RGDASRHRVPRRVAARRRHLGRALVHRNRVPVGLLDQLPPLPSRLPAHRARPLCAERALGKGALRMTTLTRPTTPRRPLLAVAPLRVEARPVRRGAPGAEVVVSGFGPTRARRAALSVAQRAGDAAAVAVVGFAGGLDPALRPGDVVVATEV